MDQIKTVLPHTWVITLKTRSVAANCAKNNKNNKSRSDCLSGNSHIFLWNLPACKYFHWHSTDNTEVFWINSFYNFSQYNVPNLKHELCIRDKERDRPFSFLHSSRHAGLLVEYYINADMFDSTVLSKTRVKYYWHSATSRVGKSHIECTVHCTTERGWGVG